MRIHQQCGINQINFQIKDKSLMAVMMLLDASSNAGAWRQQKAGTNSEDRAWNANNKTCHIKNSRVG